jgi:RsiW-degrading membrane proteinase PrsW (M82 family)
MELAVIPGLLIIIYVYGKDKVEKEPKGLIFKLIFFGVLSCIAAGYIEAFEDSLLPDYPKGSLEFALQTSFLEAALVEELVKYTALRTGSWKHPSFNYRFDGIVYGVSAAVGFAIYENIMYVASYGFETAVVRAFTAVPLHAFCGVFMGVFYSYAKKSDILGQNGKRRLFTFLSLIVPMLIHGTYDTLAFLNTEESTFMLLGLVVILYITAISTIKRLSKADFEAGFYPKARFIEYDTDL